MSEMKKIKKYSNDLDKDIELNILREPEVAYYPNYQKQTIPLWALTQDFTFAHFKKIADKSPFTLQEWAMILHISDRTLHRYAKENTVFNGLLVDRILQIEKLVDKGNMLLGAGFKHWLQQKPFSLQGYKPIELLITFEGVQEVINLLGRMEHGISA